MIGRVIGPYQIVAKLGEGGMGEVYRAHDTNLGRDVALKILPDAFAEDTSRLARFRREAHVLASLNHPGIAHLYGLEDSAGSHALVMELVDGPTLAERIAKGPIPVDEALAVAAQTAEALEAAHEQGIIHRDLKPANIKIRPDGTVKILDFGLAKALTPDVSSSTQDSGRGSQDLTHSPTITTPATRIGMILGTAAYMSPEQSRGQPVDKRADIWSFGAVFYEMLTGRRAFSGDTPADCLEAVQHREPDLDALPADTPPPIAALVRRCLTKDPRERLRDIGDARIELRQAVAGMRSTADAARAQATTGPRRRMNVAWAAAAVVVAIVASAVVWRLAGGRGDSDLVADEPTRLALSLPRGQEQIDSLASSPVLITPDGRTLVYAARAEDGRHVYRRALLDAFESVRVAGTAGAESPFLSFDGEWIGFRADGQLKKVPLSGGEAIPIGPAPALLLGATWGSDDTIVFSDGRSTGLWRVSANGGDPVALTSPRVAPTEGHRFPYLLPSERGVLFGMGGVGGRPSLLGLLLPGSSEWRTIRTGPARFSAIRYLPTGHLVFGQSGTIFAGLFDLDRLEFTSEPQPIVSGVASSPASQYVAFAVSDTGTLVYVPSNAALNNQQLVRFAAAGAGDTDRRLEIIAEFPGATLAGGARLSPAGGRVAVTLRTAGIADVWSYGLDRGDEQRITQNAEAGGVAWAPDGETLTVTMGGDLYTVAADGTGQPRLLLERAGAQVPLSWSGDARRLLFRESRPATGADLLIFTPGDGLVAPLVASPANESDGTFSPDGRVAAYVSDATGDREVYLTTVEGPATTLPVSVDGGASPRWSADGEELFYVRGPDLLSVRVERDPLRVGAATLVASAPDAVSFEVVHGVMPGTREVVAVRDPVGAAETSEVRVVLNWTEELKRLVPPR